MARKSKKETIDRINKADALEIQFVDISKSDSDSRKRILEAEFNRYVEAFVKDFRDVILVAVKVK